MHGSAFAKDVCDAIIIVFESGISDIPIKRIPIFQTDSRLSQIRERISVDLSFGGAAPYSIVARLQTNSGIFKYIIAIFVRAVVAATLMHRFVDECNLRASAIQRKAIKLHAVDAIKRDHRGSRRIPLPFQYRISRALAYDALSRTVRSAVS